MAITYESYLCHFGIPGMKWGVRRYQNKDGTLTEKGKARYDKDIRENKAKKKDNRIDTSTPDPNRWVREDTERQKRLADTGGTMVKQFQTIERSTAPKPKHKRMDLSKMSDNELRDAINREQLERRYDELFGVDEQPKISKGREVVRTALDVSGDLLTVGSSALGMALIIQQLKNK